MSRDAQTVDRSVTSPANCGLAIAVPVRRAEFFAAAEPGSGKDFISNWVSQYPGLPRERLWQEYERVAELALAVADEAERCGVRVRLDASWETWRSLIRERATVTLFAHYCEGPPADRIEFDDGLHEVEDIVTGIPEGYGGVLDFTVCRSLTLAASIKTRHPRCTVVLNKHAARLDYRLAIYRQALRLLADGAHTYVDALAEVHLAVLRGT